MRALEALEQQELSADEIVAHASMQKYDLARKMSENRKMLNYPLEDSRAAVNYRYIWCGLCCKLTTCSKLAKPGGYFTHMNKHHPNFQAMLVDDVDDLDDLKDPDGYSTAAPAARGRGCQVSLKKYTADEVRANYKKTPDDATLVSEHGLSSESAVCVEVELDDDDDDDDA